MSTLASYLLISFGLIGHVVLWTALVNRIHGLGIARWIVDALTLACGASLVLIPIAIVWCLQTPVGWQLDAASVAYLALCALVAIWSALARWRWRRADGMQRSLQGNHTQLLDLRAMHGDALLAQGIVRWLGSLPGNEVLRVHIHEKELGLPELPPALDGFRIAHVSDLHMSGRFAAEYYAAIVEQVNRWQPELIAITGDIVERDEWIDRAAEILGQLRAVHGVIFILGNHDRKADHLRIRQALVNAGLIDVGGRLAEITLRGEQVQLVGNEMPWFPMHVDIGDNTEALRFLLAHGPDQFTWAQQRGFQLMLAGHNHGGQVCFPLIGAIVAPSVSGTRYASGVFQRGNTLLHVSRGTGSLSPLRWNCPPEIALLKLRTANKR